MTSNNAYYNNTSNVMFNSPSAPSAPMPNKGYEATPPPYSAHQNVNTNFNNYADPQNQNQVSLEQRILKVINTYEISPYFSSKLQALRSFKTVFIFDDSGSMNTILNDSPLNNGPVKATRWDELQYFARISVDIANAFTDNGVDIFFLNRYPLRNVRDVNQLTQTFANKPSGFTPLTRTLTSVLEENRSLYQTENKLLVLIVTDGEPTDDYGQQNIPAFKKALQSRHNNVYTTIVSCTDDDATMNYLDHWDVTIPRLDVVDDFRNEKSQIMRVKGQNFRFSFGDYVVKSLVGSVHASLDKFDEHAQSECCTIL